MNTPKISIVLCTYNRSKLLKRMIDSILNQQFKDFELIIINNGCTDDTNNVCKEYQESDNRIRYYKIVENNGPAAGRNLGIKKAKAQYISLVDDDDFCEINMYNHLFALIEKYNADIAVTGCVDEYQNEIIPKYVYDEIYIWDKVEGLSEFLKRERLHTAPATKLFRRTLFNDIKFISGVLVDDIHVVYKLFANADTVVAQGIPTYRFYKHSSNMTSFITVDKISEDVLHEYLKMQQDRVEYIKEKVPELSQQVSYSRLSYMISMVEKIKTGNSEGCEKLELYMKQQLKDNQQELLSSQWITDREKRLMHKYVI